MFTASVAVALAASVTVSVNATTPLPSNMFGAVNVGVAVVALVKLTVGPAVCTQL